MRCQRHLRYLRLNVDRDINTSWEVELLELVHCGCCWLDDVDQALVCADFELVHCLLVNVRRTINSQLADVSRKWHRAGNACAGALCCFNDVCCRLVDDAIIEAFEADTDTW